MKMTTLCYIEKEGKYLMLHRVKKHHDINAGKWIGVGGHVENGETPEECLLREVKEETGLVLTAYRLRGLVTFLSDVCEPELMCVFTADAFDGEMIECDEGEVAGGDPGIGKGTVYRNLGILSEEGSIRRIEVPNGPDRFDFTLRNHYHGRCVRCGEVFDVDIDEMPGLIERIRDPHGMQFLSYDIMFKAICPACQMQE